MPIQIKGPNADEIFNRFKQTSGRRKALEKHYGIKKAAFNIDNVTAAEFVKEVHKEAVFFYQVDVNIKPTGKTEIIKVTHKKLEKTKFYKFDKPVPMEEWKGDKTVPMFNSIKLIKCPDCNGGKINCDKCGGTGTVKCSDCKGTGTKECSKCAGKGKQLMEIGAYNGENKKIENNKMDYGCPNCFGSGKIICSKCDGLQKTLCKKCDGKSSVQCDTCLGTGSLYQYEIQPVPFLEERSILPNLFPSVKTNMEKQMGAEISELIENVEGIRLKNEDDLKKKIIEPNLGYYAKSIDKALSQTQSQFKKHNKMDGYKPKLPIYLFPLIILDCLTPKGKKYNVYSIGSNNGFLIFGELP